MACLFGLAPDGVYPATSVATRAVSSYLAISTLPFPEGTWAVYFLWHFPSPHGVRSLTGILLCGARTFLYAARGAQRLSSQLRDGVYHGGNANSEAKRSIVPPEPDWRRYLALSCNACPV